MSTIRALPPSFDTEYKRLVGENIFCDEWDSVAEARGETTCAGKPEIEIKIRRFTLFLCREHAGYVATQVREAIELVDGGDILRASGER